MNEDCMPTYSPFAERVLKRILKENCQQGDSNANLNDSSRHLPCDGGNGNHENRSEVSSSQRSDICTINKQTEKRYFADDPLVSQNGSECIHPKKENVERVLSQKWKIEACLNDRQNNVNHNTCISHVANDCDESEVLTAVSKHLKMHNQISKRPALPAEVVATEKSNSKLTENELNNILEDMNYSPTVAVTVKFNDGTTLIKNSNPLLDEFDQLELLLTNNKYITLSLKENKDSLKGIISMLFKLEILCFQVSKLIQILGKFINLPSKLILFDPIVADWLLSPDSESRSFEDICIRHSFKLGLNANPLNDIKNLSLLLREKMEKENLLRIYIELEMPCILIYANMKMAGIKLNSDILLRGQATASTRLQELKTEAEAMVGHPFNFNSTVDLRAILYDELRLDSSLTKDKTVNLTVTKKGFLSTCETTLKQLAKNHRFPRLVLEYRGLYKLKSTYLDSLPIFVSSKTGRIHASWDSIGTATGRTSCSLPNLQAIPTEGTVHVRKAFEAKPGCVYISADYEQMELRILAWLSNDSFLQSKEFWKEDVFEYMTLKWKNIAKNEFTRDMRSQTKRVVYGLIYGAGPEKLSSMLGKTFIAAKELMESFLQTFPGIQRFINDTIQEAQFTEKQVTLFGRHRLLSNINSQQKGPSSAAMRQAVNFRIQGTAADVMKHIMQHLHQVIKKLGLSAQLVLHLHDELIYEVAESESAAMLQLLQSHMTNAEVYAPGYCPPVPLRVKIKMATKWSDL